MPARSGSRTPLGTTPSSSAPTSAPTSEPPAINRTKPRLRARTPKLAPWLYRGKAGQHRRKADSKKAAGKLDVGTEQQDKRGDQHLSAGDPEYGGRDTDAQPGSHARDDLSPPAKEGLAG